MAQAQADADFGIAGAIAGATADKAGAAAGSKAKRCQPPNLGELGDLLAAETATGW